MSELNSYLQAANALAGKRDGRGLSRLLCLPLKSAVVSEDIKTLASRSAQLNVFSHCSSNIRDGDLAPVVANHLAALAAYVRGEYKTAFDDQLVKLTLNI